MTKRMLNGVVLGAVVLLAQAALAGEPAAGVEAKAVFEQLKAMAGAWEGTGGEGKEAFPATVSYRLASGGTVVEETLGAGTPYEMVSMYHLDGNELVMTHFCSSGNQPRLRLDRAASRPGELRFTFVGGTNMDPAKDSHIHGLTMRPAGDSLHHDWLSWKGGKEAGHLRLALRRKGSEGTKAPAPAAAPAPKHH
jgi:hypothetical protein